MLMWKRDHDAIVARLKADIRDRDQTIATINAETPDERKARLRLTSGLTPKERDDIIGVIIKRTPGYIDHVPYAEKIARACLDFAFSIKGSNA